MGSVVVGGGGSESIMSAFSRDGAHVARERSWKAEEWTGGREMRQIYTVATSNVNDIETKRSEASIMGNFAKLKRNEPVE
jgi:hypothetical protein